MNYTRSSHDAGSLHFSVSFYKRQTPWGNDQSDLEDWTTVDTYVEMHRQDGSIPM